MASGYDDIFSIAKFAGINQSGDGYNTDLKYAQDGYNFNTVLGNLEPFKYDKPLGGVKLPHSTDGKTTLAFMTKRWSAGQSGVIGADSYNNGYAVAIVGGMIFYKILQNNTFEDAPWRVIPDITLTESKCDTLTYELNRLPPVNFSADICKQIFDGEKEYDIFDLDDYQYHSVIADSETEAHYVKMDETEVRLTSVSKVRENYEAAPIDCLLITNAVDGMYCIYLPYDKTYLSCVRVPVMPNGTTQDIKFGCIERYAERIFGSGITSDPDKLMYCAPFDPFNWDANRIIGQVEDGAGDIQQPNWDGDKFISLKEFSTSLLCIKQNAVWKLTGTTPSEFAFKKQFGDGTIADGSVITHGYFTYMLSDYGIKSFDGTGTTYLKYGWLHSLMRELDKDETAFAERWGDYYVLSINDELILYNTVEGTFNILQKNNICALKQYRNKLYCLENNTEGVEMKEMFGGFLTRDMLWESAWIDLSAKNITKSGFEVYVLLDTDDGEQHPVQMTVAVTSEKKRKEKNVTVYTNKPKRIRINNHGRLFKVSINVPSSEIDWHMKAGIQMYLEYDYD